MPQRFALNGALLQVIAVLDIAADAREVAHARTWITQRIGEAFVFPGGVTRDVIDTVELCASEVITNAIVHGGREQQDEQVTIILICAPSLIRVEVIDSGNDPDRTPRVRDVQPDSDTGGRGLEIVSNCAHRWDHYTDAAGRNVWFEVKC
ncbi:ATP-binding protein [Actinomadura sp. NBRC 104425]|uniref:ATP-binding protein n=1 Tax=Actinomadura sp. NBRC 104425 TaxID=3032204 RepID=UPI0025568A72|nr:ATP-binding protein [Actinomadura sp. NBRC 104425]